MVRLIGFYPRRALGKEKQKKIQALILFSHQAEMNNLIRNVVIRTQCVHRAKFKWS